MIGSLAARNNLRVKNARQPVTSIVRYFSVISAPLDQGPLKVQTQLVPSFSHAFSVCQVIYEFLPNIWSAFVKFTIFVKNLPFSKTQ